MHLTHSPFYSLLGVSEVDDVDDLVWCYEHSAFYSLLGVSAQEEEQALHTAEVPRVLSTPFWEFRAPVT